VIKGTGNAVNLAKSTNSKDFLNFALKRQGLDKSPNSMKEKWSENGFDIEVRVHPADPRYDNTGSIYRVARRKQGTQPGSTQGYGWEYLANIMVKNAFDGTPECGVGYGSSTAEALENTIQDLLELLNFKQKFKEEDFEWSDLHDFQLKISHIRVYKLYVVSFCLLRCSKPPIAECNRWLCLIKPQNLNLT
jgi:hypothetical protein